VTTFYLIRHGDKYPVPPDPGLNELGHRQAQATAKYLTQFPITKVVASPLLRTQETARYIAEALQLQLETDSRLRERLNWGDDPTQSREDFIELWRKTSIDRTFVPHIGASSQKAGRVFEEVVLELTRGDDEHVVLVTHGGVIADFLRNVFPESELNALVTEYPDGFDYEVRECSVTQLVSDTPLRLIRINDTSHL
jgi:2,3-bisphosphoglycerate-dependent phosphoglycerate mutase